MSDHSEDEQEGIAPPTIRNAFPDDCIKILLATDNHIGYLERDPIRGQDSINAFKEVLKLAVKHDVDFILLAGDLFHENRPSRDCLYQVMALLREYTLGDRPIQIELLSDPNDGQAAGYSFPAVNYEDPNLNIAIPVFSIHGNHDDPQGAGPEGALCALDMLSVTGLINYMGKIDLPMNDSEAQNTGIAVRPVLLRKGNTRLGMYGIGNVKDQRMHFELRSNRVRMYMPKDKDSWFNILLLHQNRVAHGPQQSVPEGMFDDSIDLVVWGHEHDCRIIPEPVAGKRYYITQPGSSVATSLSEGESIEKHVALLQIQGKEFELTPLPLRSVRPFVMDDVDLGEAADREGFDINDKIEVSKFLKAKVNSLIDKANQQWAERNAAAAAEGEAPIEGDPPLPLVRLKVDTTGVSEMSNPVRFGQEFQGRLANPRDVLVFHRSKKSATRASKVKADQPELSIDDPELSVAEKLSKVRVQTLVREYLAAQDLQLLGEAGMSDAIELFVDKDDIHAIATHVTGALRSLMKGVQAKEIDVDEDNIEELVEKARHEHEHNYLEKRQEKASKGKGKAKAAEESDAVSVDSMMMDVDAGGSDFEDELSDEPVPKRKGRAAAPKKAAAPAKRAPARGKAKAKVVSEDEDEDADEIEVDEPPPPPKRTNRAAILSQSTAKKAPAKKTATKAAASKQTQATLSFAPAGRSSTRAAATKARRKVAETIELDSD